MWVVHIRRKDVRVGKARCATDLDVVSSNRVHMGYPCGIRFYWQAPRPYVQSLTIIKVK